LSRSSPESIRRPPLTLPTFAAVALSSLLAACANLDDAGPAPRSSGGSPSMSSGALGGSGGGLGSSGGGLGSSGGGLGSSGGGLGGTGGSGAPASRPAGAGGTGGGGASDDGPTVSSRPAGKPDWVAVFESPREASYSDQAVIYVDRANLQVQKLDKYTYYLARTREVRRTSGTPRIQELAVLCEGSPIAPATSLRGEGTEDRSGGYSIRQAAAPLTSIDQFSTQKVRIDPNNPNTFVIRAICLLGTERSG